MTGRSAVLRGFAAFYELFMLAPLWLYLYSEWGSDQAGWPWLVAGGAAAVAGGAAMPRFNVLWKQASGALVLFAGAAGMTMVSGQGAAAVAGPLILTAGWLQGVTAPGRYRGPWYWTGVAVYFTASVIVNFRSFDSDYGIPLTAGGVICLAAALFAAGSGTLRDIALAEDNPRRIPRDLKRMGALYVSLILAGMIAMGAGLSSMLWQAFRGFLRWLFGQSGGQETPSVPPPEPQRTPDLQEMLPPAGKPGLLARILDLAFYWLSIALLAGLVLWGIYLLHRHYGRIWRGFIDRLTALLHAGSANGRQAAGFTDEETSLFSWEETMGRIRRNRLGRLLTGFRIPRYEDMPDNQARTRFLYRKWLESAKAAGYEIRPGYTPLETLTDFKRWSQDQDRAGKRLPAPESDQLIRLYNRVRYRQEEPTDEQLSALRDKGTR